MPQNRPEKPGTDLWAWLFVNAPELKKFPEDLGAGPYRSALELANQATFSQDELDTYWRVHDEIHQVHWIAEAKYEKGKLDGELQGKLQEKRASILRIVDRKGIKLGAEDRARIEACTDVSLLDRFFDNALGAQTAADLFVD